MTLDGNQPVRYIQVETGDLQWIDSQVILEAPVSLTVNGEVWLTFMCTPVDLEALAVGFLWNEGVLQPGESIAALHVCANRDNVDVWLDRPVKKPVSWRRTSGCTGGQTSSPALAFPWEVGNFQFTPQQINYLVGQLFDAQDLYKRSGGVHTSALSNGETILISAEDIGRHNTLDKIAGRCFQDQIAPGPRLLLTTGRISSEMLQKATRLGAPVVVSRTSPSSLSIELAEQTGITLIGYAHRSRFRIYAHPERILLPQLRPASLVISS